MKRSAGILPYKVVDDEIYVYLEHPGGPYFKNIEEYNERMAKSMEDKLFFVEKLPSIQNYLFVDFGCADGSMIR